MEVTENDQDAVISKSDGILTLTTSAHAVDDHLMALTAVVCGVAGNAAGTPAAVPRDGLEARPSTHTLPS